MPLPRILDWLRGKKEVAPWPEYTALRAKPTRELPEDLAERERSPAFEARLLQLQQAFAEPSARPSGDGPFLLAIQDSRKGGLITFTPGDGQPQCVPFFTTLIRAGDFRRVLLPPRLRTQLVGFSPSGFVQTLRHLEEAGVQYWALDRCPRCDVCCVVGAASMKTPEDAITLWEVTRAQHHARQELFHGYATELARAGRLEAARDVALEAAGHVSLEHASTHFLLGELAIALGDPQLLAEAKAFLHAQGAEGWEGMLDEVQRSWSPSFRGPTGQV